LIAHELIEELRYGDPKREVQVKIEEGLKVKTDSKLITLVLRNLLGNAWKFTSNVASASISFESCLIDGHRTFCVSDNGAGFEMEYVDKIFGVFQRLHKETEYQGTGIGLAIVHRAMGKLKGSISATSELDKGAKFYFAFDSQNERGR
jgi:light-regulated signal transduction histidine kinase (bacteriophytochrome)